jgi:hypothetical protein
MDSHRSRYSIYAVIPKFTYQGGYVRFLCNAPALVFGPTEEWYWWSIVNMNPVAISIKIIITRPRTFEPTPHLQKPFGNRLVSANFVSKILVPRSTL